MSILADFFIADAKTAADLDHTIDLPSRDVASYRRITELGIGFLKQILENRPLGFDPNSGFTTVRVVNEGERVTTEFPREFVSRLANISDAEIPGLAAKWAACEEPGWDAGHVEPVIRDLRRLAQEAGRRDVAMYLWNCL